MAAEQRSKGFMIGLAIGHIAKVRIVNEDMIEQLKKDFSDIKDYKNSEIITGMQLAKYSNLEREEGYIKFECLVEQNTEESLNQASLLLRVMIGKYCDETVLNSLNTQIRYIVGEKLTIDKILDRREHCRC